MAGTSLSLSPWASNFMMDVMSSDSHLKRIKIVKVGGVGRERSLGSNDILEQLSQHLLPPAIWLLLTCEKLTA